MRTLLPIRFALPLFLVSSVLAFMLGGCKKDAPISEEKLWDCHHESKWDSASVANNLVGKWKWQYVSCFWNPQDANGDEFKGLEIHFKGDQTLKVVEDGNVTHTAIWELKEGYEGVWAIETDPFILQVNGRILFCKKRLQFNDSYLDGCDHYFKRK